MKMLTTLTATMLLSTLAMAQENPPEDQDEPIEVVKVTFEALDRNSDQRVSKTEAAADDNVSSQFAALDANSDGYINRRVPVSHRFPARMKSNRQGV